MHCINQEYIFALAFRERAVSSVGSEHLVYTQGVGSSSLSPPTKGLQYGGLFLCAFSIPFMNYLYILYSRQLDRYYIGYCGMSVEERLAKHLSNHKGYTGRAKDWVICYTESYSTRQEACKRERELKSWKSRRRLEELIAQSNNHSSVGSEHPD